MKKRWWTTCSGRIELYMTKEQSEMVPLSGAADDGVLALSKVSDIKSQIDKINPKLLVDELSEFWCWDEEELKDHEQNIQRLLWIAAFDIQAERPA